ncbi:MAG: chromosomal replication initiator protein DnaA [Solobacterium sp.]|nr:chromosomal replication initiator protein DnaA [Solobacterium sp.]
MSSNRSQYYINVWDQVLDNLRSHENIALEVINTFFTNIQIYDLTDTKAILVTDNIVNKRICSDSLDLIQAAFIEVLQLDEPIVVELYTQFELPDNEKDEPKEIQINIKEFESMPIQPDRTFDNFVVGDCNRESQVASFACALKPGEFYNPLFIYGNSGLGKTHLLMAIGNYVKTYYPDKKVYYIESLKFVDKVVKAIQNNQIDQFKHYMCNQDLLLVDDIQFLAGKEKSHEIFFSVYNELVNNRKQICIASDRHPKEIKGLEDRLISRFSSGLSVGIDSPEFETSLAILRMKIKNSGNEIEDVDERGLNYIASNFSGNIRDLEGAWNRVLFYAIMFQKNKNYIEFETIVNALKNQVVVSEKDGLSSKKIIKCVADYYGLTRSQITGKTRTKNISNARHISIYLCRKLLDLPYMKIGEEFGNRDHTTIISACNKVEKEIKKDTNFLAAVNEIEKLIMS